MKPHILVRIPVSDFLRDRLDQSYMVHHLVGREWRKSVGVDLPTDVKAIITNGTTGLTAEEIRMFPNLEIILAQGTGFEGIDLATAKTLGIPVTSGSGTNVETVADHAMALILGVVRGVPFADRAMKNGDWSAARVYRPIIHKKRLGIVGLGQIGGRIADRAGGFEMEIAYTGPRRREAAPYLFIGSPLELARWADILVLSCPGGPETENLVNRDVLGALGKDGFVVNIARGTVVNLPDLLAALRESRIAGAALDVFPNEPNPPLPEELRTAPNLVMTPHVAAWSPETTYANGVRILENLEAHFAGRPLESRVV